MKTSDARYQGAGTTSSATKRIAANLEVICERWVLDDANAIFPEDVCAIEGASMASRERNVETVLPSTKKGFDTPLLAPELWGRKSTEQLRAESADSGTV